MNEEEKKRMEEVLAACECPPLTLTILKDTMRQIMAQASMPTDLVEASDHDFYCRCDKCREWWRTMGPEEEGTFGPFSREEIMGA